MTTGTFMFCGGIAGGVAFLLLLVYVLATAGKSRRRLLDRIQ